MRRVVQCLGEKEAAAVDLLWIAAVVVMVVATRGLIALCEPPESRR
jgi:hypothetical protein